LKGTTFPADDSGEALLVGWTMTCEAVIVEPSTVPRARTGSALVTAFAEADWVSFSYSVDDVSVTVTF
jgi:hypothetical protein